VEKSVENFQSGGKRGAGKSVFTTPSISSLKAKLERVSSWYVFF
jgi:hypothetical protein